MQENDILEDILNREAFVLLEDNIDVKDDPTSTSFSYTPEIHAATDSDTVDTIQLVSKTFPSRRTSERTYKRKKKRGWQKGRPRKPTTSQVNANIDTSAINSGNQHSMPYTSTFLEQQSYTQVSVEKVHFSPPNNANKNQLNESPNEMFLLKREIRKEVVQSRGFEYPPLNMHEHSYSQINTDMNFNTSPQSKQIRKVPNQMGLVKRSRLPNDLEKYGPELLPPGWDTLILTRKSGKSAGQVDVYFITPEKKRLRSKQELADYLTKKQLPYQPDEFIFRKSAYKVPAIEYNKDS